jgi:large subunit ribosomal protein L10
VPTPEKAKVIEELVVKLSGSQAAVLADFRGLNVGQVTKLRRKLRESGAHYEVYKNTLIRIAAERAGVTGLEPYLEGPTAVAFAGEDLTAPAKVLTDFAKESKILQVKAGILKGKAIDKAQVAQLANLPSREVLLAQVLGAMRSPISGLVNVLAGPTRQLVVALDAIRAQKQEAAGAAAPAEA